MPSNFYPTSTNGLGRVNASASGNRISSTVRAAGTATNLAPNYNKTTVASPSGFTGTSNQQITAAIVAGTGLLASGLHYALGTGVGSRFTTRRESEIGVGNLNNALSDPLHDKLFDRTTYVQASGITRNVYGQLIGPTGYNYTTNPNNAVLPQSTGVYTLITGSGDRPDLGRGTTQEYHIRMGLTNIDKNLELRKG